MDHEHEHQGSPEFGGRPLAVLIIEPFSAQALWIREVVHALTPSAHVTCAVTYTEGLAWLERRGFDLCLADFRLGASTGTDLAQAAHTRGVRTPIVVLTAEGDHELGPEAVGAGALGYIPKYCFGREALSTWLRASSASDGESETSTG